MICLVAAGAVLSAGCGGGSRSALPTAVSAPTGGQTSPLPASTSSTDRHRAQGAVLSHLRQRGYKTLRVNCQTTAPRRFDCRVNGAQLWQAVVTPGGSVRLRLLGSE